MFGNGGAGVSEPSGETNGGSRVGSSVMSADNGNEKSGAGCNDLIDLPNTYIRHDYEIAANYGGIRLMNGFNVSVCPKFGDFKLINSIYRKARFEFAGRL